MTDNIRWPRSNSYYSKQKIINVPVISILKYFSFLFRLKSIYSGQFGSVEYQTRKHSNRMRTVHSSPYGGRCAVGGGGVSGGEGARDRDPQEGTWDQTARVKVKSYIDPPVDRQMLLKTLPCPKLRLRAVTRLPRSLIRWPRGNGPQHASMDCCRKKHAATVLCFEFCSLF